MKAKTENVVLQAHFQGGASWDEGEEAGLALPGKGAAVSTAEAQQPCLSPPPTRS